MLTEKFAFRSEMTKSHGSQTVVPRLGASTSPRNLLEKQIQGFDPHVLNQNP